MLENQPVFTVQIQRSFLNMEVMFLRIYSCQLSKRRRVRVRLQQIGKDSQNSTCVLPTWWQKRSLLAVAKLLQNVKGKAECRNKIVGRKYQEEPDLTEQRSGAVMEGTQEQPRMKTPHNTACWDCYRHHRGCDGLRPCKRCVDRGKATSCRDPTPGERNPRKRKRPKSNERGNSVTVNLRTKQKGIFFIIDPQSFLSPKPPPVINNETCITSPSFPTFTTDHFPSSTSLPFENFHRRETDLTRTSPFGFDREIEPTETNQGEEILVRYPPPVLRSVLDTQPRFTQQLTLPRAPSSSHFTPRQSTRIAMSYDTPPSLEHFMEELLDETKEISDHQRPLADHRKTTASVFESLLVPDDMTHLMESFFTPFGLRDSTQVYEPHPTSCV